MNASNGSSGAAEIAATVGLLWPGARLVERDEATEGRRILALPSAQEPRWLVPVDAPGALGAVLSRENHSQRRMSRWARGASAAWARSGLPTPRLGSPMALQGIPSEGIDERLTQLLGQPVNVIVGIGTDRANRKPVLQVLDRDGQTVAYVKAGTSESTKALVRREAATLSLPALLTRPGLKVPGVIALETWGDIDLLVLEPLHPKGRRRHRDELPLEAMRSLAGMQSHRSTVQASAWFSRMRNAAKLVEDSTIAFRMTAMVDAVEQQVGGTTLTFGAWHGDWTAWNMTWVDDRVMLWDWERFDPDVPSGFDAIHYQIQDRIHRHGPTPQVATSAMTQVPAVLAELGIDDADPRVLLGLYLVEITARYLLASQGAGGESLRAMAGWTLDLSHAHWLPGGAA